MATTCQSDVPVFHTIATTGLFEPNFVPEICQLTLTKDDGQKLFCKYVLPEGSFQKEARKFNGFEIDQLDDKRCLTRHGNVLKTSPLCDVMEGFVDAIAAIRAQVDGRIVLIGYNSKEYDMEVVKKEMVRCGVSTEKIGTMNVVCADVFQLVRNKWKVLFPEYPGDLKMTTVYNELCKDQREYQHDALEDAEKLQLIYHAIIGRVGKKAFESCIFSFPVVTALPSPVVPCQVKGDQPQVRRIKRKSTDENNPPGCSDAKKRRA